MSNEILRVFKHSLSWTLHDKFLNNLIPILIIHERTILILKKYFKIKYGLSISLEKS